jgi:hypothetical protein
MNSVRYTFLSPLLKTWGLQVDHHKEEKDERHSTVSPLFVVSLFPLFKAGGEERNIRPVPAKIRRRR